MSKRYISLFLAITLITMSAACGVKQESPTQSATQATTQAATQAATAASTEAETQAGETTKAAAETTGAATTTAAATTAAAQDDNDPYPLPDGISPVSDLVKSFDYITIDVLGQDQLGSRNPTEDRLTPIWRAKTRVICDIIVPADTRDWLTYAQMNTVAGTIPSVIAVTNGFLDNLQPYTVLRDSGLMMEIKLEWLEQWMPETKKQLEKRGLTMEDWYKGNLDPVTGKLYYVPNGPSAMLIPEARAARYGSENLGQYPYMNFFRDDILKQIYPEARSEKEFREYAMSKGGEVTAEDVLDIPMNNLDDLLYYMRRVKDLNIVENGKPIIPAHPHMEASMGAVMWSLYTAGGYYWGDTAGAAVVPETKRYEESFLTPSWKNYIKFLNTAFNEGLLGQEYWTQKTDQANAKIVNGEYAMINWWSPVDGNRDKVRTEGVQDYGWRLYPLFDIPILSEYQDARDAAITLKTDWGAKAFNPEKVSEDMIPQLLNWIDWHYSEEALILRNWGTPDMYTGEGEDRRFKPEFKDVETYFLTGQMDSTKKDAWYYGLHMPNHDDRNQWNHEVYGIADNIVYYLSPKYVYPLEGDNFQTMAATILAFRKKTIPDMIVYMESALGQDAMDASSAYNQAKTALEDHNQKYADQRDLALLEALTCSPDRFEAAFTKYAEMGWNDDKRRLWDDVADKYWDFYEKRNNYRTQLKLFD